MIIRKIESSRYIPLNFQGKNELFKSAIPEVIKYDNAKYITNNVRIGYTHGCLFNILDCISPLINNYPKIGNKILNAFEKIIRFNNKF